jgi:hypothetical protein
MCTLQTVSSHACRYFKTDLEAVAKSNKMKLQVEVFKTDLLCNELVEFGHDESFKLHEYK